MSWDPAVSSMTAEVLQGLRPELVTKILKLERELYSMPLVITSGYRAGDAGEHGKGLAVDVRVTGGFQRRTLTHVALDVGIRRIGVYDKHIHLGMSVDLPGPVLWTGVSQ